MGPVAYVAVVVAVAVLGAVVAGRRVAPRVAAAAAVLLAAVAVAVPLLLARAATSHDGVAIELGGRPLQTVLRAGSAFVVTADAAGRPQLTAFAPGGDRRFTVPGDEAVVADDGSVLIRDGDAFVAHAADGRRLWSAADPTGGQRRIAIAFGGGRAILADRAPGTAGTVRYRLTGVDRTGDTAWTRSFIGTDSPYAEPPDGYGPARLREDVSDVAALRVGTADWDGVPLRGTDAYLTLDGEVLDGPTSPDTRFLWARGGRVVVAEERAGECRLVGYAGNRRAWVTEDCRSPGDLLPTAVRDQPVYRDYGRLRRVDPVGGMVIDLQVQLTPTAVLPCVASGGPQRQAPTDGTHVLAVVGRTVSAFPLTDRDGPDLTHVVDGTGAFRACLAAGTVAITTDVESANPFLDGELQRVEVFRADTGTRTASVLLRGGVRATDGWAPGRVLTLGAGGRTTILG